MKKNLLLTILLLLGGLLGSSTFGLYLTSGNVVANGCALAATSCDFSYLSITGIEADTFINHSAMTSLSFSYNQLSNIKNGTFNGLSSLDYLSLDGNEITDIESGAFNGLSALTYLDFSYNQLPIIENGDFNGLSNLLYLFLESHQISSIENGALDVLSNLEVLDIGFNQLTTLPNGVFDSLTGLSELYIFANQLNNLPSTVFDNLSSLTYLDLSYTCENPPQNYTGSWGSASTDSDWCAIVSSTSSGDFITKLETQLYYEDGGKYIGYAALSFVPGVTNEFLVPVTMQSVNPNGYAGDYYNSVVEVEYDLGTLVTFEGGASYTGIIHNPELFNTGNVPGMTGVIALTYWKE